MNRLLLFIISIIPFWSQGQHQTRINTLQKIKVSETFYAKPGAVYLDSIEIDMQKIFFDPDNILTVEMIKGSDADIHSGTKEAMLITRKVKAPLYPLSEIKLDSSAKNPDPILFVINQKLITDTAGIRIETSSIKHIEILRCSIEFSDSHMCYGTKIMITTKYFKPEFISE